MISFRIKILIIEKRHQTSIYFDKAGNEKLSLMIFSFKATELGNAFTNGYRFRITSYVSI